VDPVRLKQIIRNWPADNVLRLPGLRTKLKRAFYLAEPGRTALRVSGSTITLPRRRETAPVTVVVAEYNGTLEVIPPAVERLRAFSSPPVTS
jgi:hypothetical protein